MVQLSPRQMVVAVVRNRAHRLLGGIRRGGHKAAVWSEEARRAHGESIYRVLSPYVGDVAGQTGLEIAPGDNLGVCGQFLKAGADRWWARRICARSRWRRTRHPTLPSPANTQTHVCGSGTGVSR
ncbi:hypothetical protein OOT46_28045 [Aquabacterium sp. A7-Y]|uniref:hypothetical protein n=1 Tax=Aquabacterium sp. A7-Y TaxID=1349605 RepID=UPI00223D0645|nr:hypothetical protein [Aquabacterium sp. A7-Y]MCW7541656.1 hypothetical protein [Aquabacterium sp. A7-Y]